ncbi:rhodanese-like domain-containing protein [Pelagicoccus mobilis]|uniref:Rhodanese-like domain-containing protein n=1 Tax=Pelagicoccus mobilis TaxID=415221 RepID=A0A934VLY9_9BACT|nr:rhodanese-like domain-containing protein [Pelagicoccus mobilis]MBK1878286.1 rhodanese-like domain-containing protein [Pelagicoccus mobilis]
MSVALWIGLGLFVLAFVLIRMNSQLSVDEAKKALAGGAVVLDVREPRECSGGMVPGAVNVPLGAVIQGVEEKYPDKDTVLLCHCASGVRSANAVSQLKAAGYSNAYNLGSFVRAGKVVG